jgi:bifunctional DNA-binding transcriptional regulator/antitoxin component of YhaV-PrlF toxin-antitoxin module
MYHQEPGRRLFLFLATDSLKDASFFPGSKEYTKHQVVIPNDLTERLGWRRGVCLEARLTAKGVLLRKVESIVQVEKPDYEQFKEAVIGTLRTELKGCRWSILRLKAGLRQKTPSPIWVKRLEDELVLQREMEQVTSQPIWKPRDGYLPSELKSTLNGWVSTRKG